MDLSLHLMFTMTFVLCTMLLLKQKSLMLEKCCLGTEFSNINVIFVSFTLCIINCFAFQILVRKE